GRGGDPSHGETDVCKRRRSRAFRRLSPRPRLQARPGSAKLPTERNRDSHATCFMPEFMLLIRNKADHEATWAPERHLAFVKQCEAYIGDLKKQGKLIAAQPLIKEGRTISGSDGAWREAPMDPRGIIQVGYYHIVAHDAEEAVAI